MYDRELVEAVTRAYARARREVFDKDLPPDARLTTEQRQILIDLEAAEQALADFRTPRHTSPEPPSGLGQSS